MKRILVAMTSMIIAILMCVTCLTGCRLITVDNKRDMNQVVATIQIEGYPQVDEIHKKDMIISYLNYYYSYEQQGYPRDQIFNMIIDQLVENRVYVQNAMKEFDDNVDNADSIFNIKLNTAKEKWDLERYLQEDEGGSEDAVKEITDAQYNAKKDMNDLIDSYEVKDEEEKFDDASTVAKRPVPTGAKNEEKELTYAEKANYKIDTDSTSSRKKAYSKVLDVLRENDILGDYVVEEGIVSTDYYKQTLKNYYERTLITKYNKCITDSARKAITFDLVNGEYNEKLKEQKGWTSEQFSKALSEVSSTSPILYCGYDGYGLVYNLLLSVDEETKTDLEDWKKDNKNYTIDQYKNARKDLFSTMLVKDQRASWLLDGYDFDGEKFTGDYAFLENSLPFKGTFESKENTVDGEVKKEYFNVKADEFNLSKFIKMMEEYVYGIVPSAEPITDFDNREVVVTDAPANYEEKIKELMFAFSGDASEQALNTYKGYAIEPKPDGSDSEKYMQEFADGGRKLIADSTNKYGYIMVATDYGYHIMFPSQRFVKDTGFETLVDYLNSEYESKDEAGWETFFNEMIADWEDFEEKDHYLYGLVNTLSQTTVNKAQENKRQEILNNYVNSGDAVVKYESRYSDLISK